MYYMNQPGTMGGGKSLDVMGRPRGATAGSQVFAYDLSGGNGAPAAPASSNLLGSSGSSVPPIAPPDVSRFNYSVDSQSYPTYLRNLGENTAQQAFQRATNRIQAGNSAQAFMHAQDDLNNARLGYMAQAGKEELGVQNALADNWNKYNDLLAQIYGTSVTQRGQDVNYASNIGAASLRNEASSPGISIGGGRNPLTSSQLSSSGKTGGTFYGIDGFSYKYPISDRTNLEDTLLQTPSSQLYGQSGSGWI